MRATRRRFNRFAAAAPRVALACGALALLPLAANAAGAQASTRPAHHDDARASVVRRRDVAYVAGAAAGVTANSVWHYHAGSRVGADAWLGRDKAVHAATASSLTLAGIRAGVRPPLAAATVCVAGAAFELTQLRASARDATVNCVSAATTWAGSSLLRRWSSRRR